VASFEDIKLNIPADQAGQRLDTALAAVSVLSRRRLQRAIDEGGVYINKKRCRKAGRILMGGESARIVLLDGEELVPFSPEQIIWQHASWVLVHKKSGQYAQEALHRSKGTLPYELSMSINLTPVQVKLLRPVHRLDKGTSGLMMFCFDPLALQRLQQYWKTAVKKEYLAVVSPVPDWTELRISSPLSATCDRLGRYHVDPKGKASETDAYVVKTRGDKALLRLVLHTGRTHQLRVHLSSTGFPIVGDSRYGGAKAKRLMLHARALSIEAFAMRLTEQQTWQVEPEDDWTW